jgi:hypothetical protein
MSLHTRVGLSIVAVFLFSTAALAQTDTPSDDRLIPQHEALCKGRFVQKFALFKQLLKRATISEDLKATTYPNWRRIITDPAICSHNPACQKGDADAIGALKLQFATFVLEGGRRGIYRSENPNVTAEQYFAGADTVNPILCTSLDAPPPVKGAALDENSPLRVRGISDDLWIDRKFVEFKSTSPATINFSGDNSAAHTNTTKIQAALGYAFTSESDAIYQDFVPFVAANTSLTDTQKKPRTIAPGNFVAGGLLYTADVQGAHYFTLKPQFVVGTTMRSELAMLQAIYAPWTNAADAVPFVPLNTAVPLFPGNGFLPPMLGQLLFDVRADIGHYENRGDPAYITQNRDFQRFGTKFGYALIATPSNLPMFVLRVTETALYGASGSVRNLSFFDTSLTVNFDPKGYFGFTAAYSNGYDENTIVKAQTYKIGFSAHY